MNTPKSQNPEGKVGETILRWECRPLNWQVQYHQDDNGEWVKYSDHAATLTAMQRRLEAVKCLAEKFLAEPMKTSTYDRGRCEGIYDCGYELRALLRGDGKGDGVSTAEGDGNG